MYKKTLILFSSGEIGGAEKSLSRLAYEGRDKEFYLGSLSSKGELFKNQKFKFNKFGYDSRNPFSLIFGCYKALHFAKKNKIHNLYVCGFKACSVLRILSFFFKTPKIIHAIRWNPISKNKDDKVFRLLERFFVSKTHKWICNSKSAKVTLSTYCGIPQDRIITIHNGLKAKKSIIQNISSENIVLTLANFAPRKGIIEYLNVIERIVNIDNNIKFIIAGRDDMNGMVQKAIQKKGLGKFIHIPGFVKNTSDLIKISKIIVMPSILPEGCPTSILEGMALGKPAVGYNIEGLNELIINNNTGYLINNFNEKNMADSILKLIHNPDLIEKFGYNSYKAIKNNFSLKTMLKKHRKVLNS